METIRTLKKFASDCESAIVSLRIYRNAMKFVSGNEIGKGEEEEGFELGVFEGNETCIYLAQRREGG
jgi:hypothetical protein